MFFFLVKEALAMETQEGFSIREYASRMRSINVVNCWPFDETTNEETVKSLLPPITVKKFTWWLDELEYLLSQSAKNVHMSEKKMKNVLEMGETFLINEVQDVEATKLKALGGKMKAAPKKRSIVEIFAVAPQIEKEDGSFNSSYNSSHEEINWGLKGKRNEKKKKKKNKEIILRKAKRVIKKLKKKKKTQKGDDEMDKSVLIKENQNSSYSGCVSILERKQHLDANKKTIPCKASKSSEENQNRRLPVRGILKNHAKAFSLEQSMECILQEPIQVNHCSKQKANKHVTFSDKDGIFRPCKKPSRSLESLKLHNFCDDIGKDSNPFTKQNNEEERFSGFVAPQRSTLHGMNQHFSDSGLRDEPHNPMYACPSGFFCYNNCPNVNVVRNSSNSTCKRMNKDLETPGTVFPPLRFKDYLRTYNESSLSEAASQSTEVNNVHSFQFQTFPHLSPKECPKNFCSLPDGNQTRHIHGRRSINCISEDFVGLPLNSQGELITLNSSAKTEFNQMMNSSVGNAHSVSRSLHCITSSMDQLNLFPVEMKRNLDLDFLKINEHSFYDSQNTKCKEDNHVQKIPGNDKNQLTMRLMGKEFIVGEKGFQEFEDGQIWKDKQIIDEPSLGKSRETLFCRPSEKSMYTFPHFDCQTSSTYHSVFLARKFDPVQTIHPNLSPGTLSELYNSESFLSEPFTSENESRLLSLELPTPRAAHSPISAIRFPFMHPDFEGHAKSSWSRRSSVNNAPLFFDISRKREQLSNSQSYCTQHTVMPCYPGILPASAVQKRHGNDQKKFRQGIKSRIGIRGLDISKKSKGQVSALSNWMDSYIDTARTCPIKLTAVGKHILQSCQHIDQSSSMSTNPDVLYSGTTTGFMFPRI